MTRGAVEFVENKQANSTILQGTTKQDMKAVPWLEVPCRAGEKRPRWHRVPALVRLCKITLPAHNPGTAGALQSWPLGNASPSGSENLDKFLLGKYRAGKYILLGRRAPLNKHAPFITLPGVNCVLVSLPTQPAPQREKKHTFNLCNKICRAARTLGLTALVSLPFI